MHIHFTSFLIISFSGGWGGGILDGKGPNLDQELILGGADYSDSDSDSVDLDDLIEMDSSGDDLGGQGGDGGGAGSHDRDDPGIIFRGGRPGVFGRRHGGVSRAGGER